jgi:hypothetical protein
VRIVAGICAVLCNNNKLILLAKNWEVNHGNSKCKRFQIQIAGERSLIPADMMTTFNADGQKQGS